MANVIKRFVMAILDRASAEKTERELAESLRQAGQKGGANFLRELRAAFEKRMADLKIKLAKGLISPAEFKKQGDLAAKQFNTGLIKGMEQARKAGNLTDREYQKLSRTLKRTGDAGTTAWQRIKSSIAKAGATLALYFGGRQILRFLGDTLKTANEAAAIWNRLAGALDTVGVAFQDVEPEIRKAAKAMQAATVVGDEDFAAVLTELVTTSGDYAASLQNVQLVADLAAAKQIDLRTAAQLVGKVMAGEIGTLKRYGIIVAEGADAIEVMRQKFKGMAENEAKTLAGQTKILANAWGDFKEALGLALADMAGGTSILQRLTRLVQSLEANIGEIVASIVALGKALVVGGVVAGVFGLVRAIRAATFAATGFLAILRSGLLLMGPKGWFILGVAALTEGFRRLGKGARDAAREAREAMQEFKAAAQVASDEELDATAQGISARAVRLAAELARLRAEAEKPRARPLALGRDRDLAKAVIADTRRIADVERELNEVREQGSAILAERQRRARLAATEGGRAAEGDDKAAKRQLETFQDRADVLETEIVDLQRLAAAHGEGAAAVEALTRQLELERDIRQAVKGLTVEQADALGQLLVKRQEERDALAAVQEAERQGRVLLGVAREIEVLGRRAVAIREGAAAVEALNRQLFIEEAVLRSGAEAGSEFAAQVAAMAAAQLDAEAALAAAGEPMEEAAERWASPWVRGLERIRAEVESQGGIFEELGQAWATGGFKGLAELAKRKVKENLASAIEMIARAVGSFALGNPTSAAKFLQSAAQHGAAAAAWKGLASGAGGGGGAGGAGAAGGGVGGSNPNLNGSAATQPRGPEVHVYLTGPGFDAMNPEVQRVVHGALEQTRERYGANATVTVRRAP